MSDPASPSPSTSPVSTDLPRRRISPWLLIFGGGTAAVLLFACFAALMVAFNEDEPAPLGLASVKLPDGRLLVLEDVTFGTSHNFNIEMRPPGFSFLPFTQNRPLAESTQGEKLMLWLSCRDPVSLRHRDFDWWLRCVAVDEHGEEIEDQNPGLNGLSPNGGSSSYGGTRPMQLGGPGSGQQYEYIIAHSSLPRVRHQGKTFQLRVYDQHDQVVAELDVPDPSLDVKGQPPNWTPDPYPAVATVDDLTVTLTGLSARVNVWEENGRDREYIQIEPQIAITRNGEPAPAWSPRDQQFFDALGNESGSYNFSLSPHEAAWKVQLRLFREVTAAFTPDEIWTTPPLEIPDKDQALHDRQSKTLGGVSIEVAALGGPGVVKYADIGPARHSGSYSGSFDQHQFEIDTDWNYGPGGGSGGGSSTTVTCDLPHVAARIAGNTPEDDVRLLAADDQAREVKVHGPYINTDVHFWFLETAADAKSVELKFIAQKGKSVEFLVAPPEIKHAPQRLPTEEVLRRLAEVTQTPLLITSNRLGNAEILLAQPGAGELINLTHFDSYDVSPAWSPDGTQIAFSSWRNQIYNLYVMSADGGALRQLTTGPQSDHAPAWSPDGQRLCFRRDTGDAALNWELFLINADGAGETNITNNAANDADPAWSPDGERIAFTSTRAENRWCLYSMRPDGSDAQLLSKTPNGYVYPAWSPDGRQVAFAGAVDDHYEIFVIDADGQNEQRLTQLEGLSTFAAWSPDGRQIAFIHRANDFPYGRASLYIMQADGSDVREIAPVECPVEGGRPAWKPQSSASP
jgi:TolB protein